MQQSKKTVSIKDVAAYVGLSVGTVSMALNNSEKIVEKLPAPFSKIFELKKSLTKLENINKSVDELMRLNIPYGENINKYEQLSRYIIKANSIQSEISNYIKKS